MRKKLKWLVEAYLRFGCLGFSLYTYYLLRKLGIFTVWSIDGILFLLFLVSFCSGWEILIETLMRQEEEKL